MPSSKYNSARLPRRNPTRSTIFIDESGGASLKDKGRFFILTGVIAKNSEFEKLIFMYSRIKQKHLGFSDPFHAVEFFSPRYAKNASRKNKLLRISRFKKEYVQELATFIDTIPFVFCTVIVDKQKLLKQNQKTRMKKVHATSISKTFDIWLDYQTTALKKNKTKAYGVFLNLSLKNIMKTVKRHKVNSIDNYAPLEIALKALLQFALEKYLPAFTSYKKNVLEICFESSPDSSRIIGLLDKFKNENDNQGKKTKFSKELKNALYMISFPNKGSLFLGIEIADLISYGHLRSVHRKMRSLTAYYPIWQKVSKRKREIKKNFRIESCLRK